MNDSRARRYAEAMGTPLPQPTGKRIRRIEAVMAVADAEQAELRDKVARLRLTPDHIEEMLGIDPNDPLTKFAKEIISLRAKVARVETLAESWAQCSGRVSAKTLCAAMLRLALADHEPEHIDDSDICEDCNARHAGACP